MKQREKKRDFKGFFPLQLEENYVSGIKVPALSAEGASQYLLCVA